MVEVRSLIVRIVSRLSRARQLLSEASPPGALLHPHPVVEAEGRLDSHLTLPTINDDPKSWPRWLWPLLVVVFPAPRRTMRRHVRFVRALPFTWIALLSGRLTDASRAASARNDCTSSPKRTG
jgi:hypothetical protein